MILNSQQQGRSSRGFNKSKELFKLLITHIEAGEKICVVSIDENSCNQIISKLKEIYSFNAEYIIKNGNIYFN